MCISMCGQILYGVIMFACLALTLGAMFTSNWTYVTKELEESIGKTVLHGQLPKELGLFPFACRMPGDVTKADNGTTGDTLEYCEKWWNNLQTWEKVVIAAMCLAVVFEVVALIWNGFTWCACCCKQFLLHPLTILSFCAVVALGTAVAFYGLNNQKAFEGVTKLEDIQHKIKGEVGYSFWLAVGALALAVVDTILGALVACLGESCL